MSKKIRTIIIGAVVLLLLAGATAALLLIPKDSGEDEASGTISYSAVSLVKETPDDLVSLKVKNSTGEYEIRRTDTQNWEIPELSGLPQTPSAFSEVKSSVAAISSNQIVAENCDNLSQYGLENPAVEFEADFGDGKVYRFALGDVAPNPLYRYGILNGENTVYTLSTNGLASLEKSKFDYLDHTVIPEYEGDTSTSSIPEVALVRVERPDMEKPIEIIRTPEDSTLTTIDPLVMTGPVDAMLDSMRTNDYIYGSFGLRADEIVAVNPTAEDLEEYGLAAPSATFTMTYGEKDENTVVILAGKALDADGNPIEGTNKTPDSYYAMTRDGRMIYRIAATGMPWVTVQPKDLISSVLTLPYVKDVASIEVTLRGVKHEILLTSREDGSSSGSGVDIDFTLDGKPVDEAEAKHFYQLLLSSSVQDVNLEEVTDEPVLTIQIHQREAADERIDFYELEDLTTIVALNGQTDYIGRPGYVDRVEKELRNLTEGKPVDPEW